MVSKLLTMSFMGLILILTACGNQEDAIPFNVAKKTTKTPISTEEAALKLLGNKSEVAMQSISSRSIRNDVIGVDMDVINNDGTKFDLNIFVSYDDDQNLSTDPCSRIQYKVQNLTVSGLMSKDLSVDNLGQIRCLENCKYILLIITRSPSAVADSNGQEIPGKVPMILETTTSSLVDAHYIPTKSFDDQFMRFPQDTVKYCMKPTGITLLAPQIAIPISPNSTDPVDYNYFDPGIGYF